MNTEMNLEIGGVFTYEHIRNGEVIGGWEEPNIVVDEGLTYALGVAFDGSTSAITTWYLGVYENNYTPLATDIAGGGTPFGSAGVANEITTEYTEANRPAWVEAGVVTKSITNSASQAVFTFGTAVNVNGAFLISENTKGGTTGTLGAASKFAATRSMLIGDVLNVTYTLNIASS